MKKAKPHNRRSAAWTRVPVLAAMLSLVPAVLPGANEKTAPRREASILFSDGAVAEGTILLTPGVDLRLVGIPSEQGTKFGKVLNFNLNIVSEITFSPYREFYKKHFRFKRGTAIKIYEGDPYPIREPKCTVVFTSGEKRTGILHSTVLYLKEKDPDIGMVVRNRKFILRSKQKGKPGQKHSDLVYITRIRMLDQGDVISRSLDIELLSFNAESEGGIKALTRETLTGVPVKPGSEEGKLKVFSTFGESVFLAAKIDGRYVAGWPEEGTRRTELYESVEKQFNEFVDYYNERKLLGILPLDNGTRVFTLARLRRQAPAHAYRGMPGFFEIDGNGEVMEFFRLSVWLWNRDPETGNMVMVDRGSFYRFRIDAESETPEAGICPDLWPVVMKDGRLIVGKREGGRKMSTAVTQEFERLGPAVGRANTAMYITTVILGFLTWFVISAGTWLTLFILDNLLKLPAALRFPFAIAATALTVWALWKNVIGALRSRSSNEHVALMLERKYGINENVLINTIQFEEMNYGEHQKEFVQETARAGTLGLRTIPLRDLWQFGRMILWWVVFALLIVLWSIYLVKMPGFAVNAFFRYSHSLSDVPPIGSVTLDVTPHEDVVVAEHDNLEIKLVVGKLEGYRELTTYPEMFYREGQGMVGNHRGDGTEAKMEPVVGKPNLYTYTFEDVRRSFAFRIFVRDTYTRSIQVTVNPAPQITGSAFHITPPAYVAGETRLQAGPPHPVKCLPGSRMGIEVTLDKEVEWMHWLPPEGRVDFRRTAGLAWRADGTVGDSSGVYDVKAKGSDLAEPVRIATGTIMLKTDRKPHVRFVDTAMSRIVTPGERLPLLIEATDDYGIAELKVTARPAYGGSSPQTVLEWDFGDPPGMREKAEKKFELVIDASIFVPGSKYFLEGRASDFCEDTSWGVSEPILLTVKTLENLTAAQGSGLDRLYQALEQAIRLQKEALDGTRNLSSNINNVWMKLSRELRGEEEIQNMLNKFRGTILGKQLEVRTTLLRGVNETPDKQVRLAVRMKEIAEAEGVEANHRSFASCRRPYGAGELDPAVEDAFELDQEKCIFRFDGSEKGRYFGLVVLSPRQWTDETWMNNLSLLDQEGKPLDTAGWRILSSRGGGNVRKAFDEEGWPARGRLPHFLVVDMGTEHTVTGIVCGARSGQAPKEFMLYLSTREAPDIAADAPDKAGILEELALLQVVQESIYNQLLALKGREAEKITKKKEEKTRKALGEEGWEQAPSVAEKLEDFRDKLKVWTKKHDENTRLRKAIMAIPPEDFTDADRKELEELNLQKRTQARKFGDMVEDLARLPWDFADEQQVKIFKEMLEEAEEMKDMVDLAAEEAGQGAFSWNLDTMISREGKEMKVPTIMELTYGGNEPGQSEASEDKARPLKIGELPTELPLRIPKLKTGLENMMEPPMSGSSMFDHSSPTGSPLADNLDSASADGQMTNHTPNPRNKTKGRGNLGRSGQADGQMVADKAPAIKDDETAMPPRMSNAPSEPGSVNEQGSQPATAIGLGKGTGKPVDFARQGKLPPDQLHRMREFAGEVSEIRENCRNLMLALDRHNLPTTDLRKVLLRLQQIELAASGGQGIEIRRAINTAIKHVDDAGAAIARSLELRRLEQDEDRKKRRFASGGSADTIPDGYKDIVTTYFKRLAEESAETED